MSAMIDIVFLLLVFFVMTFQVVPQEGDFTIEMRETGAIGGEPQLDVPLNLRLTAKDDGGLASIRLNGRALDGREELLQLLLDLDADSTLHEQTLHLACDYELAYDEVIKTLDVVTGRRDEVGNVRPLASKVSFVSPR